MRAQTAPDHLLPLKVGGDVEDVSDQQQDALDQQVVFLLPFLPALIRRRRDRGRDPLGKAGGTYPDEGAEAQRRVRIKKKERKCCSGSPEAADSAQWTGLVPQGLDRRDDALPGTPRRRSRALAAPPHPARLASWEVETHQLQ